MKESLIEVEQRMKQALAHFHDQLKTVRTGRASLSLLEGVLVDYYGTPTPLNQVANLSVADATLIVAQPWDPSQIAPIEKAILKSDLGLNPSNDGKVIRIPVPQPTEERRKELVRKAHELAEQARNSVRAARRDGNEEMKRREKEKEMSEDDAHRGLDQIQKLHDHYIQEINSSLERKEKEILTV